jgi:hypothetical protein
MCIIDFYRQCYLKTGWLPAQPLTHKLAVGDVCQIRNGRFLPLLNIGDAHLVENLLLSYDIPLDTSLDRPGWNLSQGTHQSFSEILTEQNPNGEPYQLTRQAVEFLHRGNFIFHAKSPQACLLLNWSQIRDDLTLKLTQLHYSFRHAYVVTGVATAENWGLAVAGQAGARLEMSAEISDSNCYALLSHDTARVERSTGIACFEAARGTAAHFFQAKKLVMSDAMFDRYLTRVVENKDELGNAELAHWLRADLFDQIKSNELNLTTSISFFNWVDMSLDDVELLTD